MQQETRDFTKVVLRVLLLPYGPESHDVFKQSQGNPCPSSLWWFRPIKEVKRDKVTELSCAIV
jgi:hypothetical protein